MSNQLYSKNFMILVIGQIISLFGSSIQRFALSLYLLDLTGSASIFATILAISMLPIVLVSPIAGILADRGDKKKWMVLLDTISGVILMIYSLFIFQGRDHVVIVAIMMVLLSVISTLYQPIVNTCIPILVADDQLVRGNAIIQQVASLSNFLGPLIAGVLYGVLGIKGVIILNIISFLFSAVMEMFLTIPFTKKEGGEPFTKVFANEMKESYHYLKNENPIIFRMIFISGLYNLFLVPIFSVGAPYIIKVIFGMSSEVYGMVEGFIALGMIIGGMIIAVKPKLFHIKKVHRILYITAVSIMMMGVAVYLHSNRTINAGMSTILFAVFGMLIMLILGIANVLSASYIYQAAKSSMLGKVSAFGAAFATLCIPLGQLTFGLLVEGFLTKLELILYLSAVLTLMVTLLVRWNVNQIKDEG